jgi:hypothetical protein
MRRAGIVGLVLAMGLAAGLGWRADHAEAESSKASANNSRECKMNALEQSICIYELILADMAATYEMTGGGGISGIRQVATTSFVVSVSQEERTDLVTYEIDVAKSGAVSIAGKKIGVESP